jgi:hypothetical protein
MIIYSLVRRQRRPLLQQVSPPVSVLVLARQAVRMAGQLVQ